MSSRKDISDYNVADFLEDDSFRRYILHRKFEGKWIAYKQSQPQNLSELLDAEKILLLCRENYQDSKISDQVVEKRWLEFRRLHFSKAKRKRKQLFAIPMIVVLLVAAVTALFYFNKSSLSSKGPDLFQVISTGNGEIKELKLPDQTAVVLNANSKLEISNSINGQNERRVKLSGKAYFEVSKASNKNNLFIIETAQGNVNVLGTKFDIASLAEKMTIRLDEGSVNINYHDNNDNQREVWLRPGESVTVNTVGTVSKHKASVNSSSWRSGYFSYNETPITEVIRDIEYQFGVTCEKIESDFASVKVSGSLSATNISEALEVLGIITNTRILQSNNIITIEK